MPSIRVRQPLATVVIAICASGLTASLAARQSAAPKPKQLTAADLRSLRWIEGSWRGTGGGVPPFFERYHFESPAILVVESLEGEKVTSTSRYELKDGEFSSGSEASRAVATALDDKSITFEFAAPQRGSFRWERVGQDSWKAVLNWPASSTGPAGERVYQLERRKQ